MRLLYLAGASISWHDSEVAQTDDIEKSKRVEVTQSMATELVQQGAHNESSFNNNEVENTTDDRKDRGKQLDRPMVTNTQEIQEPDGQDRDRANASANKIHLYSDLSADCIG